MAKRHELELSTGLRYDDSLDRTNKIYSVEGQEGSGKSSLVLSAEGEFAYFSVDPGSERAVKKARRKGKKVAYGVYAYDVPEFKQFGNKKHGKDHWEEQAEQIKKQAYNPWMKDWNAAVEYLGEKAAEGETVNIVQDTASETWEMFRLAHFGKLQQNPQLMYGPVNAAYKQAIKKALNAGINVFLIHQVTQAYKKVLDSQGRDKSVEIPGKFKRAQMNKVGYFVDVFVQTTYYEPKRNKRGEEVEEGRWEATILMDKETPENNGQVIEEPDWETVMGYISQG